MKKLVLFLVILVITNYASWFFGSHECIMAADVRPDGTESCFYPHFYNAKEALREERQIAMAAIEALHRFYGNDDNDFWFDSFMKTKEYQKLDSLFNHDWEDFYDYETPTLQDWYSVYGTEYEPTEEYKDSVDYGLIKVENNEENNKKTDN